jgi:hypothetical protein
MGYFKGVGDGDVDGECVKLRAWAWVRGGVEMEIVGD